MKRIGLFLALVTIGFSAGAYDFESAGIYYNILGNGNVEVTRNVDDRYSGVVNIPATVTYNNVTYNVTAIGDSAFIYCGELTSVVIPAKVAYVGESAFEYCARLTSVILPDSLTYIGLCAFAECRRLTSVVIPTNVTYVGDFAFGSCDSLTSVVIPTNVTYIGRGAFAYCGSLTSIILPDSLTHINDGTFGYCSSLTLVVIPANVTYMGESAFYYCPSLENIYCYATMPPVIEVLTFSSYNATLHVPANSVSAYLAEKYWKNFFIVPLETSIQNYDLADNGVRYYNGTIHNAQGLKLTVYNMGGQLVTVGVGDIDMRNYPRGMYIVTDDKSGRMKVMNN